MEVIDFVVVVLSVANAASGKLLDLNMIRMVRWVRQGCIVLALHQMPSKVLTRMSTSCCGV